MTNGRRHARTTARKPATDHPANGGRMPPGLDASPPVDRWESWTEPGPKAGPHREEREYTLVPTTCFNCESAWGLLAYVDKGTGGARNEARTTAHTCICSSGGRAGYAFWMGFDRPSPDYASARVIFLISAHLESGHYFNPHAQRIIDGRRNGAKLIVLDALP